MPRKGRMAARVRVGPERGRVVGGQSTPPPSRSPRPHRHPRPASFARRASASSSASIASWTGWLTLPSRNGIDCESSTPMVRTRASCSRIARGNQARPAWSPDRQHIVFWDRSAKNRSVSGQSRPRRTRATSVFALSQRIRRAPRRGAGGPDVALQERLPASDLPYRHGERRRRMVVRRRAAICPRRPTSFEIDFHCGALAEAARRHVASRCARWQ